MAESRISMALCGVMEQALIEKGISPEIAKMLAERACQPVVETGVKSAKRVAKRAGRKLSKYQKEWGRQLKKLKNTSRLKDGSYRKGWDQAKEFSKAHKMTKKEMKKR